MTILSLYKNYRAESGGLVQLHFVMLLNSSNNKLEITEYR